MSAKTRKCRVCGLSKPLDNFYLTSQNGKQYHRHRCKACDNHSRTQRPRARATEDQIQEWNRRDRIRQKANRKNRQHDAKHIYWDSRKSDRKKGLENDLNREYIEEQISKGCVYCGEIRLRMTLDRIRNDQGHTKNNVIPACIRCNYVRKDMPYEAWLIVADAMRKATSQDAFGNWTGRARGKNRNIREDG